MLEQFVAVMPGTLGPALLVMCMSVMLTVGEGRDKPISSRWRLWGILIGLVAAIRPTIRPMRRQCELIGLSRPSPTVSITLRLITSNAGAKVPGITATNCSSIRVLSLFTLGSPL